MISDSSSANCSEWVSRSYHVHTAFALKPWSHRVSLIGKSGCQHKQASCLKVDLLLKRSCRFLWLSWDRQWILKGLEIWLMFWVGIALGSLDGRHGCSLISFVSFLCLVSSFGYLIFDRSFENIQSLCPCQLKRLMNEVCFTISEQLTSLMWSPSCSQLNTEI